MDLSRQVAVVTGAGRGLGRAIALKLAEAGADLVLASRTGGELEDVCREVRLGGRKAIDVVADLTDEDQAEALMSRAYETFGRIDVLVNNVGLTLRSPIAEMTSTVWLDSIRINLNSAFYCTRAVVPRMMYQRSGKIINICSVGGHRGSPRGAAYSSAKFGMLGLAQSVAQDLKEYGISVSSVLPGPIATAARARNAPDEDPRTALAPADVADVVLFLATRPANVIIPEIAVMPRKML